jgi:hypothetical protein
MTEQQKSLVCFAVNSFGTWQHPEATPENLEFFAEGYIKACLKRMATSPKVADAAKKMAKELLEAAQT